MDQRFLLPFQAVFMACALAGCDAFGESSQIESAPERVLAASTPDPVIARALHDPLMSDPDLARRSQANAVLGYADSSALPVLEAGPESSRQAREAMRSELLKSGAIASLPAAKPGSGGATLGDHAEVSVILAALNAPAACTPHLREGFDWAARLTLPAAIMPLGMEEQSAGTDGPGCRLRLVRYLAAASFDDTLTYHHTLASRAQFKTQRFDQPETILIARGPKDEHLHVHIRSAPGGMQAVDVVFWAAP